MANRVSCSNMKETANFGVDDVEDEVTGVTFDILDDDDDILIQAEHITYSDQGDGNEAGVDTKDINFDEEMEDVEAANISIGLVSNPIAAETDHETEESGFDFSAGNLWIYPTNYPVRDYQYNIVQKALYKNTLVVLPTGLGKTFIAAVVMYNFFRWFPQGKIVFMAPTKPLVAQQIQACYNIMGIPKADTIEMTGTMNPAVRQKAWQEKRVVFLTPQVMTNDLSRGSLTANSIKCLVLDEAHKALGNHAYCQVVRELVKFTRQCRILALSATPGGDLKAVQQVMNNLLISHIELRSEESLDICQYTHERKVEKIVVPLGEELSGIKVKYIKIMSCVVERLIRNKVLYNRDASKVSTGSLLKSRVAFRQNPPHNMQQVHRGSIEADFSTAISLCYGFALLQNHGLRSLYNYLTGIITGEKGYGQTRYELLRNADFNDIVEMLRQKFLVSGVDGVSLTSGDQKIVVSHPKLQRLEEIVVAHFRSFQNNGDETRVMIFSEYRDSVQEIASILNQHQPLIKAMPFIGQSSAGKSSKGYTQKDQLMVMRLFREGGYNTLISTCVGEEGLDIGDVDLIICFDAHNSPVRLVQRMGRTGRKRKGRIVMLVTEGKEEQIYNQSLYSMKKIHKAILNGAKSLHFYPNNPRMVPSSVSPQCHKMHITLATDVSSCSKSKKTPRKSKILMGSRSRKISSVLDNQEKKVIEDEYLTAQEYVEIKKEFSESLSISKHLPRPKCITLSPGTQNLNDKSKSNIQQIDFAEWMPWQNRLQGTHLIGHSIQSIHLVKASEFIELQQCLGEEEDHYASEMNRILNVKDIGSGNDNSDRQSSMFSFLTNVHDASETEQINRLHSGNKILKEKNNIPGRVQDKRKHTPVSKTKKVKQVKAGEASTKPVVVTDYDSSLDEKLEKVAVKIANLRPGMSKLFTELNHDQKSNIQNPGSSKKEANASSITTRSSSCRQATNKKAKRSRNGQKVQPKGTKIKRKSLLDRMESNSYKIPSEDDNDDFEIDCPIRKKNGSCVINLEKANISNDEMQGNTDEVIDSIALDVHMVSNDSKIKNSECEESCAEKSLDNNARRQIQEYNVNTCSNIEQSVDFCNTEAFRVPTPPPISGVKELLQGLKSWKDFAELDLEELMEQWRISERGICKAGGNKCEELFLGEKRSDLRLTSINITTSNGSPAETELTLKKVGLLPDDVDDQVNHLIRSCDGNELLSSFTRESPNISRTQTVVAAKEKVKQSVSKSPLFKGLTSMTKSDVSSGKAQILQPSCKQSHTTINALFRETAEKEKEDLASKSVHGNKQLLVRTSGPSEKIYGRENKEVRKTSKRQGNGFCEDSSYSKHSEKNHAGTIETSHQIQLHRSSLNNEIDSVTEYMNHEKLSVITELDETGINTNVLMKEISPGKFHESFVTFTQAMEYLQTSSSEEALKDYNISTPLHVSPSKCGSVSRNCQNNLDIPQFDLGFDLDDDDDIIPPTPIKNMSQESIFGFKTFISSKNISEATITFSSSTNCDKTSEAPKKWENNTPEGSNSASGIGMGTDAFEPVVSAFDLKLSSDEDSDWKHSENIKMHSLHRKHHGSEVEALKNTLDFECDNDESEFYHSSPKRQKLPFDAYSSNSEKELINTAGNGESPGKQSTGMSEKSNAGKLRLGKRLLDFPESACQKSNTTVIAADVEKSCKNSNLKSCKRSLDEVLKSFDEADEHNQQVSDNISESFSHLSEKLITSSLDTQSVCRIKQTSTIQSCKQASPGVWECPDNVTEVKASTPVRNIPGNNQLIRNVLNDDGDMPSLTPIRAHTNERGSDSDHSFVIRRRKRVMVLDVSADLDARAETSFADTNQLGKVCAVKKSNSCIVKGVRKTCSDDTQQISISDNFDDDIGDFVDNHNVAFKPKQRRRSKKIKIKNKIKEAADFIEKEAEVSGDEMSSDEHEEMDDLYESSFIDNNTEMTQTQGADMKAVYLKSIKSPVLDRLAGRYKMQYNTNKKQDMHIFSQTLPEDHGMSEYEEDSFCVGSDEEEDISYLEEESQFAKPKQQKFSKTETKQLKRIKNRIKVMSNSSSEEDKDSGMQLTQEFSTLPCKNGRRVLLSSSEDEESKEGNTRFSNKKTSNTNNLDISCRIFPKDVCNNTVRLERLKMTKITDGKQTLEQDKGRINTYVSTHPGLEDRQAVDTDVGNFDMFEDWFNDYDLPVVDTSKSLLTMPSNQKKLKTKTFCTDSKFLSVKNTTSKYDESTNEVDLPQHESSVNDIASENITNFKLQKGNSVKNGSFPSSTHVSPVLCINSKDPSAQSISGGSLKINQEQSTSKELHLSHCSTTISATASDISSASFSSRSKISTAIDWSQNSQLKTDSSRSTVAMTREERLRRQKEKQEMYQKKVKHVQQISGSTRPPVTDFLGASVVIHETDTVAANADISIETHDASSRTDSSLICGQDQISPVFTKLMEAQRSGHQLQILVDSREISGAQEIISALRLKHCIAVTARQLSCCDYILSNHLAADRIQWSTFSNSSYRSKLSARLCEMQALYERCVLIVEVDRIKTGQEKSRKPIHRTKYLDTTLSYLTQSKIKVYLTDNAEETATTLADLCRVEKMKGRDLNVPVQLSSAKEEAFKFIVSMPGVTVPQALNLAHRFRSIVELLSSPAGVIQERGCMTLDSAQALHKFLHHKFDVYTMAGTHL